MAIRRVAALSYCLLFILQLSRILLAFPPSPVASGPDEMNFTLEGKITEKTPGKLTVSSGENVIFHVLYNEQTEIRKKDGSVGNGEDLHTGLMISVAGDLAESGEITAKKIEIETASPEKR
jgi:hypothetical protein